MRPVGAIGPATGGTTGGVTTGGVTTGAAITWAVTDAAAELSPPTVATMFTSYSHEAFSPFTW